MKVLIVNVSDVGGGAAIAGLRLVEALNMHGIEAVLGVPNKKSDSPYVIELPKKRHCFFYRFWRELCDNFWKSKSLKFLTQRLKRKFVTTNTILHRKNFHSQTDINWINNSDFDIVNLHWICGVICNKDIAKIKKPIVWTMHDTWPFCGAEHYPNVLENDVRYTQDK